MTNRPLRQFILILALAVTTLVPLAARGTDEESWVPVEGQENWRREVDISEEKPGTYNVIIRGRDYAGNEFIEGPYNIQIDPDSDLPVTRIIYPEEGAIVRDDVNIIGIAVDDDEVGKIEVALNEGSYRQAQGTDYWRFAIPASELDDGVHTIRVRGVDIYGVVGHEITGSFILDTKNPIIAITSHENGAQVSNRVRFEGFASDANQLEEIWLEKPLDLTGTEAVVNTAQPEYSLERLRFRLDRDTGEHGFSFDVDTRRLEDGPHVYWIRGVDKTGAESRYPFLFFVDNKAPDITILNPGQDESTFGTIFINGAIQDTMGIERFWYQWNDEEVEIPLTSGNPFWNITLDTRQMTERTITVPFYATDTSGNESRTEIRVVNDREAARPIVRLFELPVLPQPDKTQAAGTSFVRELGQASPVVPTNISEYQFPGEESLRVSPHTLITGRLDGVHPGVTVMVEGLWEEPRSLPANPVFSFDLRDVGIGTKTITIRGTDEFGYESLPRQIKLTIVADPPEVSLEGLRYTDVKDSQPSSYRPGLEYDPQRAGVITALVKSPAKLSDGYLVFQPGTAAIQRGAEPGVFADQPVQVKAKINTIPGEERGADGANYRMEADIPKGLGYGPVQFQVLVMDEFSTASAAQGLFEIRDLRRIEADPQVVISDERFTAGNMQFSTTRPVVGTIFGVNGLPQGPDNATISLVYPTDEDPIIRLNSGSRGLPGSRTRQSALFEITPIKEGTVSGVIIRAELADGVVVESAPFSVQVDLTNPELSLDFPNSQLISGSSLIISGEARDQFRVDEVSYSLDEGKTFTAIPLSARGSGVWSFRTSVELGEKPKDYYGFILQARDSSGRITRLVRGVTTKTPEALPTGEEAEKRRNDQAVLRILAGASAVYDGQKPEGQNLSQNNLRYGLAGIVEDLDGISRIEGVIGEGEYQTLLRFDSRNHYQDFILYPDELAFGRLEPGQHSVKLRAVDRQNEPGRETRLTLNVPYPQPSFSGAFTLAVPQFPVQPLGSSSEVIAYLSGLPTGEIAQAEFSIDDGEYRSLSKASADDSGRIPLSARLTADLGHGLHTLWIRLVTKDGWAAERATTLLVVDQGDSSPGFSPRTLQTSILLPKAEPRVSHTGLSLPDKAIPALPGLTREWSQISSGSVLSITDSRGISGHIAGRAITSVGLEPASNLIRVTNRANTLDISPIGEGSEEELSLIITTIDGVQRSFGPFSVTVDLTAPTLELQNPPEKTLLNGPVPLVLSSSDVQGLAAVEYRFLELEPLLEPKAKPVVSKSTGSWKNLPPIPVEEVLTDFPDSSHSAQLATNTQSPGGRLLLVRSRDNRGRSTVQQLPLFIDLTAPQFSLLTPPATVAVNGRTTVSGRIAADSNQTRITAVEYSLDGESYTNMPTSRYIDLEVDFSQLTQNEQTLHIRVSDAAGNQAVYTPRPRVDLEADFPRVEIQIPEDHAVITEDLQISGMVFDDDGVDLIYWRLDDGEFSQLSTKNNFILEIPLYRLSDNEHVVQIYAVDRFGLEGEIVELPFTVSLEEPKIFLDTPGVDDISRGVVDLIGRSSDMNGVEQVLVSLDNGTSFYRTNLTSYEGQGLTGDSDNPADNPAGEGEGEGEPEAESDPETGAQETDSESQDITQNIDQDWLYQLDTRIFVDGTYSLQITATDRFGILGQYFTLVTIDNTNPVLQIDQPAEGSRLAGAIPLSGRVTDNIGIHSLTAQLEPINKEGDLRVIDLPIEPILQHEIPITDLEPGWYNLRIIAVDGAGNEALVDLNVQVADQVTSSSVDILYPLEGEVQHGPVTIEGRVTGNVPVDRAQLYVNDRFSDSLEVDSRGYFWYKMEPGKLPEGPITLRAVVEPTPDERISSPERKLSYQEKGPYLTIDSHQSGDVLSNRPFISGTAGFIHGLDPEIRDNREAIEATKIERLTISLDNGKTFSTLPAREEWRYRIETGDLNKGPLAVILRADYRNGSAAVIRSLYMVDKEPPRVTLLSPLEGSRVNDKVTFQGTADDEFGLEDLEINLRPGDKAGYSVPEFIQGMYLDIDFLGLTYWKLGLGLSFFDDNVKLQANFGIGPEEVGGEPARMSGYFIGGKILANIASIPFSAIFGPDWTWLSMNIAIGADFSYIHLYNPIEFDTGVEVNTIEGVVLSAIVAQIEFPRITIDDLAAFNTYSFYTEPEIWFVPSDVDPKIVPKITFGIRVGLF